MLHRAIEIRTKNSIQGNGLFTTELIPKGTLVWELDEPTYNWEEILTWDAGRRRDFDHYGFQCGVDRYSLPEGMSREANHSCDPNTWWSGSDSIITKRDIEPDEEVTYDYSSCDIDLVFEMECTCGSSNCRKTISNLDYLDLHWQKQYLLNLPPHVLEAIKATQN